MSRTNFFKKEERTTKTAPRPRLRPAPTAAALKERQGGGGKGKGGEATPKYDTSAKDWKDQVAKFNKKGGINNDGRFGYGYVDTETGIEVPWYIDMINGGGANAAGDTFVSPFENAPMGGGLVGIGSQAISGGLNAMGVAPYGSNRPRYFMPAEAARVNAEGDPVKVDLGAASTGGGSSGGSSASNKVPLSTILPIVNANQAAYEAEAFPSATTSQAAASENAYFGQTPQVRQDLSGVSSAPTVRSGLVGYNPQVSSGVVRYTPTPTQGVIDEVYLPAGTQTGAGLGKQTSAQRAAMQRANDYIYFRNQGGKSSFEEWLQGIYR